MQSAGLTREQEEAVKLESSRVLDDPSFKTSDRCSRLFRYLVEEALKDDGAAIKERRAGHDVFGRDPGYDTATDPIIRNVASEIRKRLRNFYNEERVQTDAKIELPPGTYVPKFKFRSPTFTKAAEDSLEEPREPTASSEVLADDLGATDRVPVQFLQVKVAPGWVYWALGVGIILSAAVSHFVTVKLTARRQAVRASDFWAPVFAEHKEVFISLGHALHEPEPEVDRRGTTQRVTLTDLEAYTNVASFLSTQFQRFQMRLDSETKMADLRDHPAILIGNINNEWVLRLTKDLHYRYNFNAADKIVGIQEDGKPSVNVWQVSFNHSNGPITTDFALAERFRDSRTGDFIICIAGAGTVGTRAASELLTNEEYLALLPNELSNPDKNIQIVVKASIVDGVPGPPEIVKTYIW